MLCDCVTVPSDVDSDEWGEFAHLPSTRFSDFAEIRAEIERETERTTGRNKGISKSPIHLKIYSPHVLNLTVVDLPGITKVPVGDQPTDIEMQIRTMCHEYISNPSSVILAVSAANTDIANSDALKVALEVDPEGARTIGVLTKVDLMDSGTDALDILHGRVIPLRHGFVGVVNRSQKDINEGMTIREALVNERHFFQRHPAYRSIASRMGSQYLAKVLNLILMHHIRDCLPTIKTRIMGMLVDIQHEMSSLGEPVKEQSHTLKGGLLLSMLSKFAANFGAAIDGKAHMGELSELYGGARIAFIFNEVFVKLIEGFDPCDGLSDTDIQTAIFNATGCRAPLFVPEGAFEILVRRQVKRLEQPGLQCVDLVYDELMHVASQCESAELRRFDQLRDNVIDVVHGLLRKTLTPTQTMISNLIHMELAHINTSHPDFIGGSRAVQQLLERMGDEGHGMSGDMGGSGGTGAPRAIGHPEDSETTTDIDGSSPDDDEYGDNNAFAGFLSKARRGDRSRGSGPTSGGGTAAAGTRHPTGVAPRADRRAMMAGTHGSAMGASGGAGATGAAGVVGGERLPSFSPGGSPMLALPHGASMPSSGTPMSTRERMEVEVIKSLLQSYFSIVKKNFADMVPKTIMCFLVNYTKENLQSELVRALYRDEGRYDELLKEADDTASRRRACLEMQALLARALEIVHEVREFAVK